MKELPAGVIDAGIRYLHSDPGLSEALLVQGIYEAMSAATGKHQVGDDGLPLVSVTQEFKDQADYDAEISSAASNLLRNNTLGLSGSLPEMVAALLKLAAPPAQSIDLPLRKFIADCAANGNDVHIPNVRSERAIKLLALIDQRNDGLTPALRMQAASDEEARWAQSGKP